MVHINSKLTLQTAFTLSDNRCADILLVGAGLSLSSTVLRVFSNLAYDVCLTFRYAGLAQRKKKSQPQLISYLQVYSENCLSL